MDAFENEMLKEHLWLQARGQLKEAWSAYISKHFTQSSAGPSANPSKARLLLDRPLGLVEEVLLENINGFTHKPVSFAVLMLVSEQSMQNWVVFNSILLNIAYHIT